MVFEVATYFLPTVSPVPRLDDPDEAGSQVGRCMPPLQAQVAARERSPSVASVGRPAPRASRSKSPRRSSAHLYEDAFARQERQRLRRDSEARRQQERQLANLGKTRAIIVLLI